MKPLTLNSIAENWLQSEEKYFEGQPISQDFIEIKLLGNKRTWSQINEWCSAGWLASKKEMDAWDLSKPHIVKEQAEPEIKKFTKILSSNMIPQSLPDIGYFELYKSSKFTDFITGSFLEQYGLIVSDKIKNIFSQFNIGPSKFYPLTLELKGQKNTDYHFLRTTASADDYIDFERSKFIQQDSMIHFESRREIDINSLADIQSFRETNAGTDKVIVAKQIYLKSDFPDFDYFRFSDYGIFKKFISPKLAAQLSGTTGIEIKETNRLYK